MKDPTYKEADNSNELKGSFVAGGVLYIHMGDHYWSSDEEDEVLTEPAKIVKKELDK
jgi:hypothetical protein